MFHRILFRSLQGPAGSMVLECSDGQGSTQKCPTAQLAWSSSMLLGVLQCHSKSLIFPLP